jgi:hypothetical protein
VGPRDTPRDEYLRGSNPGKVVYRLGSCWWEA